MHLWIRLKCLLLGLGSLIFGVMYGEYIYSEHRDHRLLKASGVAAVGSVDGASSKTKSGVTRRYLTVVHFFGGARHQKSVEVNDTVFDKHTVGDVYVPSSISIKYLPKDPAVFQIDDPDMTQEETLTSLWFLLLAGGSVVVGLYLLYAGATGNDVLGLQ